MAGESAREVARRAREKAEHLQRRAAMFDRGADGEGATAEVLAALPREWAVVHDVRWPGRRFANVDHVVLGPGGIFVIDSKNWSGEVDLLHGRLRQNGRSREKDIGSAADAALAVAELIPPYAHHVVPVLCFAGSAQVSGWSGEVMVCSTDDLTQMLLTREPVLNASDGMDAWFQLDRQLTSAASVPSSPPIRAKAAATQRESPDRATSQRESPGRTKTLRGRKPSSSPRSNGRRRSVGGSVMRAVIALGFALGVLTFGPAVALSIGDRLTELFVRDLGTAACEGIGDGQAKESKGGDDAQSRQGPHDKPATKRSTGSDPRVSGEPSNTDC